ncbi:morphogenetic protein [Klebsiella michiganensis]|uniref:morphogenetic protein n=1 Tax=Klebsiella michiganensis TaxID=1134687 RepID=UPI00356B7096
MTKITERGMIFNGEMVRAILEGRKTQTRRPVKFPVLDKNLGCELAGNELAGELSAGNYLNSAFGKPGDRIWVRETFQGPLFDYDLMDSYCKDPTPFEKPEFCVYKTDGVPAPEFYDADDELHCCWRPSIHMPRWASRILLEITDVRVERLNAISEEDATAEGVPPAGSLLPDYPGTFLTPKGDFATAKVAFQRLWESIYGAENWLANPWVWVIKFKRVEGGAA